MPGDNFRLYVQSGGWEHFVAAMKLAFAAAPGGKATHCAVTKENGLVLFWSNPGKVYPNKACPKPGERYTPRPPDVPPAAIKALPFPMQCEGATRFAWEWLNGEADYGEKDWQDDDVSEERGFVVYNQDWGHVMDSPYGFVGVLPAWQWYGK